MATLVVTDNRSTAADRDAAGPLRALGALVLPRQRAPRGDALVFGPETRRITGTERLRDEAGVARRF